MIEMFEIIEDMGIKKPRNKTVLLWLWKEKKFFVIKTW